MYGLGSQFITFKILSNKQQPASVSIRPSPSNSQHRVTAWLHLGISTPGTNSSPLRLLYSSGRVAPSKTQLGNELGLHHPGNSRASTPSRQLQTKMQHHHPSPAQLILCRGWRLVVSGHSQSLQLTSLGKSFPLICQQQTRINCKRRVY